MPDERHEWTDHALLERWRAGDAGAGETLFERHYDRVAWYFHNKAGAAAMDLVQRTFLACVETRARIRKTRSFRSYLFGVARNVLFDHYRLRRRDRRAVDIHGASAADLSPGPVTLLAHHQEQRVLLQALRRIPIALQEVLEYHFWEKLTAVEIAEILDIPEWHGPLTPEARARAARPRGRAAQRDPGGR